MASEMCRLCLDTENLVFIFDSRIKNVKNMKEIIFDTTGVLIEENSRIPQKVCSKCCQITTKMYTYKTKSQENDKLIKAHYSARISDSIKAIRELYPGIKLPMSCMEADVMPIVNVTDRDMQLCRRAHKKKRREEKERKRQAKKAALEKAALEKAALEKAALEKAALEKAAMEKAAMEKAAMEKAALENAALEKAASEKAALAKAAEKRKISNWIEVLEEPRRNIKLTIKNYSKSSFDQNTQMSVVNSGEENDDMHAPGPKRSKLTDRTNIEADRIANKYDSGDPLLKVTHVKEYNLVCEVCSAVIYNSKDHKSHLKKHMKCNLCKRTFRTMQDTINHTENECPIKNIMNTRMNVSLVRIDEVGEIRNKYATAFKSPAEIESVVLESANANAFIDEDVDADPLFMDGPSSDVEDEVGDIDVANDTVAVSNVAVSNVADVNIIDDVEVLCISDDEEVESSLNVTPQLSSPSKDLTEPGKPLKLSSSSKPVPTEVEKPVRAPRVSEGGLRPDIEIVQIYPSFKNSDFQDSDANNLRKLLRHALKYKNTEAQTNLPDNAGIVPGVRKDKLFELKNLRRQLAFYTIPVNVNFSTQYTVNYGYEKPTVLKPVKAYWNNLPKCDVVRVKKNSMPVLTNEATTARNSVPNGAAVSNSRPPVLSPQVPRQQGVNSQLSSQVNNPSVSSQPVPQSSTQQTFTPTQHVLNAQVFTQQPFKPPQQVLPSQVPTQPVNKPQTLLQASSPVFVPQSVASEVPITRVSSREAFASLVDKAEAVAKNIVSGLSTTVRPNVINKVASDNQYHHQSTTNGRNAPHPANNGFRQPVTTAPVSRRVSRLAASKTPFVINGIASKQFISINSTKNLNATVKPNGPVLMQHLTAPTVSNGVSNSVGSSVTSYSNRWQLNPIDGLSSRSYVQPSAATTNFSNNMTNNYNRPPPSFEVAMQNKIDMMVSNKISSCSQSYGPSVTNSNCVSNASLTSVLNSTNVQTMTSSGLYDVSSATTGSYSPIKILANATFVPPTISVPSSNNSLSVQNGVMLTSNGQPTSNSSSMSYGSSNCSITAPIVNSIPQSNIMTNNSTLVSYVSTPILSSPVLNSVPQTTVQMTSNSTSYVSAIGQILSSPVLNSVPQTSLQMTSNSASYVSTNGSVLSSQSNNLNSYVSTNRPVLLASAPLSAIDYQQMLMPPPPPPPSPKTATCSNQAKSPPLSTPPGIRVKSLTDLY